MIKIYITDSGTKYYLQNWFVVDGLDHVVFTQQGRYAMRFRSQQMAIDYMYQLRVMGYQPWMEV